MTSLRSHHRNGMNLKKKRMAWQCYLILAMPIIGFFVFNLYPVIWQFRWSMYSYDGIPSNTKFIGMENFKTMLTTDFTYWKTWLNTIIFTVCKIPIELTLALVTALFLTREVRGKELAGRGFFRSVYFMPGVVSVAIVGLIFSNMFSHFGVINTILMKTGILTSEVDWFTTRSKAMTVLVLTSIWSTYGINVLYFQSALANVPKDVYEAADIDGAGGLNKFFKVTLPMIAPVLQTILLLSMLGTLGTNDIILVLTGGAPGGKTFSVMSYLTKQFVPGFASTSTPQLGYGCAMSVVTTILMTVIALIYNKISGKMNDTM